MHPVVMRETLDDTVDPAHSALLVIDVQNDLCGPDCRAMLPRLAELIAAARDAGVYVVYIQNVTLPNGLSDSPADVVRRRRLGMRAAVTVDGTEGVRIVDQVAPRPDDPVVRKHRMNAFLATDLDQLLRCRGIETIVCTGVATNGCVLNTALAGICQDYYVVVPEDCVATGRSDLHELALGLLKNTVHWVVDSSVLGEAWQAKRPVDPEAMLETAR
jgi:nicotinamidase-related amidase